MSELTPLLALKVLGIDPSIFGKGTPTEYSLAIQRVNAVVRYLQRRFHPGTAVTGNADEFAAVTAAGALLADREWVVAEIENLNRKGKTRRKLEAAEVAAPSKDGALVTAVVEYVRTLSLATPPSIIDGEITEWTVGQGQQQVMIRLHQVLGKGFRHFGLQINPETRGILAEEILAVETPPGSNPLEVTEGNLALPELMESENGRNRQYVWAERPKHKRWTIIGCVEDQPHHLAVMDRPLVVAGEVKDDVPETDPMFDIAYLGSVMVGLSPRLKRGKRLLVAMRHEGSVLIRDLGTISRIVAVSPERRETILRAEEQTRRAKQKLEELLAQITEQQARNQILRDAVARAVGKRAEEQIAQTAQGRAERTRQRKIERAARAKFLNALKLDAAKRYSAAEAELDRLKELASEAEATLAKYQTS